MLSKKALKSEFPFLVYRLPSSPIMQALLIGAFVQHLVSTCGFVMVTCGRSVQYFWWGVMNASCFAIAVSLGVIWGPIGVAAAVSINVSAILSPSVWVGLHRTPVPYRTSFLSVVRPFVASSVIRVVLRSSLGIIAGGSRLFGLFATGLFGCIAYLGMWAVLPRRRQRF